MNKFHARRTACVHDHAHASKLEADRCDDLHRKEAAGEITHLEQQPVFKIEINGKLVCRYIADFEYRMADSGLLVIEDAKGRPTPTFNLKRKLVEASHPGTVITLWPPRKRKTRKAKVAA